MIGGDMNGHVGGKVDGYEGVHGGKGFGVRNAEGEMLLEFAGAMKLVVLNTWFTKNEAKKVTYDYGGNKTVVDYKKERKKERRFNVRFTVQGRCRGRPEYIERDQLRQPRRKPKPCSRGEKYTVPGQTPKYR